MFGDILTPLPVSTNPSRTKSMVICWFPWFYPLRKRQQTRKRCPFFELRVHAKFDVDAKFGKHTWFLPDLRDLLRKASATTTQIVNGIVSLTYRELKELAKLLLRVRLRMKTWVDHLYPASKRSFNTVQWSLAQWYNFIILQLFHIWGPFNLTRRILTVHNLHFIQALFLASLHLTQTSYAFPIEAAIFSQHLQAKRN